MEENKENKENLNNIDDINNNTNNIDDLPEPEITENEMKEIIDFINNWDYEKYERDAEVREALLLLRSKMKKEEAEKEKQLEELRIKENDINTDNINNKINIDDQPEPEITENEMKEIIDFINNWDYEKYERDSEVREALLLLRSKMKEEEKEKAQHLKELRIKEKNEIINNQNNNDIIEEEENKIDNLNMPDQIYNNNKINVELSEKEKEMLEKNWNSSTKPDYGEKIVNEKGDKEIIINNDKNDKKMKKVILYYI